MQDCVFAVENVVATEAWKKLVFTWGEVGLAVAEVTCGL